MNLHTPTPDTRRKAVWGPRRISVLLLILICGATFSAEAAGRHAHEGKKARAGMPSSRVKHYKLDDEQTRRAMRGNPVFTTNVIVTLVTSAPPGPAARCSRPASR